MTTSLMHRTTDPATSKLAAASVRPIPNRMRLLEQFAKRSQTSEMAAEAAGLLEVGICYWKRVSELVKVGYLRVRLDEHGKPMMWLNQSGRKAQVYIITGDGREALRQYKVRIAMAGRD